MNKICALLLALGLLLTGITGAAEPTGEYNYYIMIDKYGLVIMIDSSWEKMALDGRVIYVLDDDNDEHGSLLFSYADASGANEFVDLFRVDVYAAGSQPDANSHAWSTQNENRIAVLSVLAQPSGKEYDAVLAPLTEPQSIIMLLDPNAKWEFECTDIDGNVLEGASLYGGKLTMINVWATYCGPCIVEMPHLGELALEYADKGLAIVGIISDVYSVSDAGSAKRIISDAKADYLHVLINNQMGMLLGDMQYVPTTLFVDEHGAELGRHVGSMSKQQWTDIIDGYLNR